MMFGVVLVGTYTSIFIAAPILIYLGVGINRADAPDTPAVDQAGHAGEEVTDAGGMIPKSGDRFSDKIMALKKRSRTQLHFPRSAPIEAYGKGGFAFAEMSHRGSLLCLPDAIWAWSAARPEQIDRHALAKVFEAANGIDTLILGYGDGRLGAAAGPARGIACGAHRSGCHADGTCDPYLQHHAGRAATRRGRPHRGALTMAEQVKDASAFCADLVRTSRLSALRLDAVPAGCASPRRCLRSTPSTSRYPASATRSVSPCRARCACNGGSTC